VTEMTPQLPGPPLDPDDEVMDAGFEDYWGFDEKKIFYFPDGKQWIQFQAMTEGQRRQFQKDTRADVLVKRGTGDTHLKVDPGEVRHALIHACVTGWNLHRRNKHGKLEPVTFSKDKPGSNLDQWLNVANPKIIDKLERAIRKENAWLLDEATAKDIQEQIDELQEQLKAALEREAGEDASTSR
jgi:hypothetical protein